ncbi:MAG: 3-phosphoshikimate 1-carboxyvinyltransferase [Thermodesulfobacteriota bacterium]
MSLTGSFRPPGDKSISHRLALVSLLARGSVEIRNFSPCADVASSLAAVRALGVTTSAAGETLTLEGRAGRIAETAALDCGNSGTTIRLLMGLLAGRPGRYSLTGDESLRRRPMERAAEPLRLMGARVETAQGRAPVVVEGRPLTGLEYRLPVASAQLKSALLLAGVQARGETRLFEPAPSRDHTERMLGLFGAKVSGREPVRCQASEIVYPREYFVPGDASSAAFFLCAAAITPGGDVCAEAMLLNPTRTGFLDVLRRMGARVEVEEMGREPEPWGRVRVRHSPVLTGVEVSGRELPRLVDEVPILALTAALARGTTVFHEAGELRVKESDRLAVVRDQLGRMDARVSLEGDRLVIEGPARLKAPSRLDSSGDHRVAMTLRLALRLAGGDCPIKGEESAAVSYPGFHEELARLWP